MKIESRLCTGLTLLNALTLSRTIDNGSGSLENQNGNAPAPQDFYNLAAEEGFSNYHQPYNNTTSVIWELPVGRGRKFLTDASPIVEAIAGGWMLSGDQLLLCRRAGDAHRLRAGHAAAGGVPGLGHRPGLPRRQQLPRQRHRRSRTAIRTDHQLLQPRQRHAAGRSQPAVRQRRAQQRPRPAFWQVDFVAAKNFPLPFGSRTQLQFRFEAFNLLNRTNFRAPNGTRSAGAFGTITSTYDARQLQVGLKLAF